MGAYHHTAWPDHLKEDHKRIQSWIEVWAYASDAIYRGFVADDNYGRTLFVFFEDHALGQGLKSGLMALFELASMPAFDCSHIVACVPRSGDAVELDIVRDLGWCGFSLTTLERWTPRGSSDSYISTRWLFLDVEV
ncbi:hypothetical protein VTN02DRAFT_3845 [Thermoascus thermophilus]